MPSITRHVDFSFRLREWFMLLVTALALFLPGTGLIPGTPTWVGTTGLGVLDYIQIALMGVGFVSALLAYVFPFHSKEWQSFWGWSLWCWVIVFGRTVNWGRILVDNDLPHFWFNCIAIILLLLAAVGFFRRGCWRQSWELLIRSRFPFWILVIGLLLFAGSEIVEHQRLGVVVPADLADVYEEAMEIPVFLSVLFVTWSLLSQSRGFSRGGDKSDPT
ncbi:MAG: hypothetical protein LBU79_04900 [Planctomycetota bacterium]|jgi:hypothetical protein|nr:hypothetical protein [Planctomycetota bacterium]